MTKAKAPITRKEFNPFSVIILIVGVGGVALMGVTTLRYNHCISTCATQRTECVQRVQVGQIPSATPPPASGSALPVASAPPPAPTAPSIPLSGDEIKTRELSRCASVEQSCAKQCRPLASLVGGG
jgi:hypothetical protein